MWDFLKEVPFWTYPLAAPILYMSGKQLWLSFKSSTDAQTGQWRTESGFIKQLVAERDKALKERDDMAKEKDAAVRESTEVYRQMAEVNARLEIMQSQLDSAREQMAAMREQMAAMRELLSEIQGKQNENDT